jgi:hypothetical protein
MNTGAVSPGARQAGLYLAELLRYRYRKRWYRPAHIKRMPKSDLHHGAIARVLVAHLRNHPSSNHEIVRWEQLESLVSLALRGRRLTPETLSLFIEAFGISPDEAARLWRAYEGTDTIRVVVDAPAAVPPATAAALRPGRHRTHFVQDHHYLGKDRLPYRHETLQMIESTVDEFDRYAYAFDTSAVTVEVLMGGRLTDPLYQVAEEAYAFDITLNHLLTLGERHTIQYETIFHYEEQPNPEFRRATTVDLEAFDCRATFHPARLPAHVWWTVWNSLNGEITEQEEIHLDDYHTARYYFHGIGNTVAGLQWQW